MEELARVAKSCILKVLSQPKTHKQKKKKKNLSFQLRVMPILPVNDTEAVSRAAGTREFRPKKLCCA